LIINLQQVYYYFDDVVVQSSSANVIPQMNKIQEDKIATDLSTIYFDTNSEAITESEKAKLQSNIKILNDNKNLSITIGGFTDSDGSDSYNIKLGERRAKNVKDYLLQNGYQDKDNITIKSFGKIPSSDGASKAKNRRVELFFTPKSLNVAQKEAIVAASKLYGYVRWFYPTDVLDTFNWDKFLNKTIIQISNIEERVELRKYIISRFSSIAPELRFFNDINTTLNYKKTIKFNSTRLHKKKINEGMGQAGNKVYDSQLVDCKITVDGFSAAYKGKNYTFKDAQLVDSLPLSISLYCPLVLPYQKYSVDKIRNDSLTNTMSDTLPKYSWLTSSIMVWNTVQHFYPYLDVLTIDWQPKMNDLVEKLNQTTSENEFVTIMKSLVVQINDGHAGFGNWSGASDMWLPFTLSSVNNKLVVSKSFDANIKVNDELIKMDGIDCIEKFKHDTALISGTKNHKTDKALSVLTAINKYGTFSHLLVKRNNTLIETDVKRDWLDDTTKVIQYLANDLIYVDCSRVVWQDIDSLFNKISNSKGVIFDMRSYLTDDGLVNLLSHLLQTRDTANSWMQHPIYLFPNQKNVFYNKAGWALEPKLPSLSCPVVFLAGGGSISYNESMLGLIKHYKLGKIIGEKTAGSNGSRNWINLPNDYFFSWTGMYVTLPDGSPLQNIGIEPDILAKPNPQATIYADYILKAAIDYLLKQ
jgi:outer membrane protein OmpA-like peptidoglycan-associated protein